MIRVIFFSFILILSSKLFSIDYPKEYNIKRIKSDFKSMSGVNGLRRNQSHQGIDIIGPKDQPIIAIKDGTVLEVTTEKCWGPTVVIDHGKTFDNKNLIVLYGHVGETLVVKDDTVKRGDIIAKLPSSTRFRCMVGVRHLHLQIGQIYKLPNERTKKNWGYGLFLKDGKKSLNPHLYWARGKNKVSCFDSNLTYPKGTITYPFPCNKR